jgi:hypothetical protein
VIEYPSFLRTSIVVIIVLGTFTPLLSRFTSDAVNSLYIAVRAAILALIYLVSFRHMLRFGMRYRVIWQSIVGAGAVILMLVPPLLVLALGGNFKTTWTHFQNMALIFLPLTLVGMFCVRDMDWLPPLRSFLVRLGLVVAIVCIVEWLVGYNSLRRIGVNVDIGDGGFGANFGSAQDSEGAPLFRAFSTMLNHYDVGAFMVMSSLALLSQLASREISVRIWIWKFGAMVVGVLVTYNVTAWLLMVASNVVAFILFLRSGRLKVNPRVAGLSVPIFAIALGLLSRTEFARRLTSNSNADLQSGSSVASRLIFLYNGSRLIAQKPWGWGWNRGNLDVPYAITTDNYFMWITVFGGIWYTAVVVFFFVSTIIVGLASLPGLRLRAPVLHDTQVFLLTWVAAATACGFSNYFVSKGIGTVSLFWLSTGMVWAMAARSQGGMNEI